ncbi:MAG: hypothetical protein QOG72_3360 [Sphingomonadales bacterium]|nr:hypothetical protein [Sphingomonadales bacterium]
MNLPALVIFDTSTLPEYYNDVQTILALPQGHVVTYDYGAGNVAADTLPVLTQLLQPDKTTRAILAYMEPTGYSKGAGTDATSALPEPTFQTLTRLARVLDVREIQYGKSVRYYIDLELLGYPSDRDQAQAKTIVSALRASADIPMKTYVALCPALSVDLFAESSQERGFSQIVTALSEGSQFSKDTFWRLTKITYRTKSLIPLRTKAEKVLTPKRRTIDEKSYSFLDVVDQSTLHFYLQFHRGKEHGTDYRIRWITVEGSPKSSSDLVQSGFWSRSFGLETVAISIPATSSLSTQEARFQLFTKLHADDEKKDYPYGPQLVIAVRYSKDFFRSLLAIAALCTASGLFAWAAFSTAGVDVRCRIVAIVLGVLASLYAYYLWTDEVALDKARRT